MLAGSQRPALGTAVARTASGRARLEHWRAESVAKVRAMADASCIAWFQPGNAAVIRHRRCIGAADLPTKCDFVLAGFTHELSAEAIGLVEMDQHGEAADAVARAQSPCDELPPRRFDRPPPRLSGTYGVSLPAHSYVDSTAPLSVRVSSPFAPAVRAAALSTTRAVAFDCSENSARTSILAAPTARISHHPLGGLLLRQPQVERARREVLPHAAWVDHIGRVGLRRSLRHPQPCRNRRGHEPSVERPMRSQQREVGTEPAPEGGI